MLTRLTDEAFHSLNRRYVYNVNDYLNVGDMKGQLAQCFSHSYRRRKYAFLIVWVMKQYEDHEEEGVLDPVLELPVYYRQPRQWIFGLPRLEHESLYMVGVPTEPHWEEDYAPYVVDCDWGVAYL